MKNTFFVLVAASLSVFSVKAQNDNHNTNKKSNGIAISLGASGNYYYGPGNVNFGQLDNNRLNWQVNGMLGLTLARDKNDRRTMIAGFGSFGINNATTMGQIFEDQGYTTLAANQNSSNNMYQLEGGLLIAEVFRISTGVGQQLFNKQTIASGNGIAFQATSLKYNSTTVGFNFNVSVIAIVLDCSFEYGQDYSKTVIVPSAGLMLRF
jgi:hypothetical protein